MIIYRFSLIFLSMFQIYMTIVAKNSEDYARASYEMLWVFFFIYLYHKEFDK